MKKYVYKNFSFYEDKNGSFRMSFAPYFPTPHVCFNDRQSAINEIERLRGLFPDQSKLRDKEVANYTGIGLFFGDAEIINL